MRAVQADPLERHQLGQQHLADERVGEPEAAGRAGLLDDQAGPAGLGDLVDELGAAHLLDEAEVEGRAGDGGHRQRVVGRSDSRDRRRPVASRTPSGSEPGSHAPPVSSTWRSTSIRKNGLPGGDLGELLPERTVGVADRGEVVGDIGGGEAAEAQPLAGAVPAEVGERGGERMGAGELGVAVGADDEQPRGLGAAQDVAEQRQRRLAGPVQVVEHEQDRRLLRPGAQQLGDGVEQGQPLGVGIGPPRRRLAGSSSASSGTTRASSSTPRTARSRAAPSAGPRARSASTNGWSGAARSSSQRP